MPFRHDPLVPPPTPGGAPLPLQGLTLMIVDDSRFACDALRLILNRAGARLRRAESLEIARLHLNCYRPDLAIIDLGLPDGRGEDLIAELSAAGFPVLGISGDPDGRDAALDAGAAAFVEKPIGSVAGLVRLIRQLTTGVGPVEKGEETPSPAGDPVALRDDLARAASLIAAPGDPGYARAFVQSLARASGDLALEAAVRTSHTAFDRARLARMIAERLAALASSP
ncbi:response regulator [Tabrizicola sp.]|jgi:DNA-binding response OmpR family regulator|uniref:response regulator n=1 Tax=Tabrizicola sp. TaxID=2005166 RepID=UPI0025CC7434|nr:response regulator [Tabrizicola sp.]MBY0351977.1 response regulator [Tabrizicola sp.]MDK2775227.1 response regulator [Tabrizicola sp.]